MLMLLPSVERYLAREVMVMVGTLAQTTLTAPAITFCPYNDSMLANIN